MILAVGAILVARLLGPFSYGLYTLTVAIPVLLVALADAGMNFALVRLPVNPVFDYEARLLSTMGED